ncbi:MAG: PASTA domain-containing protein, partial [Angustibacter sp.]
LGITLGEESRSGSDKYPKGQIISTNPEAGAEVDKTSSVAYVLSTGPSTITVPNVVGTSESDAQDALKKLGLKIGATERVDDSTAEKDEVLETSPAVGTQVAPGEEIILRVASGKVKVPNVVNLPLSDAIAEITKLGLKVDVTKYLPAPEGTEAGIVLEQTKRGESVDQGAKINLTVSQQAQAPPTTPPTTPLPSDPVPNPSDGGSVPGPADPGGQ